MPNCFELTCKITKKPVSLNHQVDKEICDLLSVPISKTRYGGGFYNWFDIIGLKIAMGSPLGSKELRDYVTDSSPDGWSKDEVTLGEKVLTYLENTYTSNAWA